MWLTLFTICGFRISLITLSPVYWIQRECLVEECLSIMRLILPSRYALLYGPNSFLLPRLGMVLFGESMTAFKLPGIILALTSLALTMSALRSSVTNSVSFSLGMIYFCGTMLLYREKYFWVRSDPQILFWTALGVFAASRRSAFVASAILGIAVGGCINVKIHTCLFFSPLVVMVLMRATIRDALVMVVAATAMMMLPVPFISGNLVAKLHSLVEACSAPRIECPGFHAGSHLLGYYWNAFGR